MGADWNTLKLSEFNPHRKGVAATSSAAVTNRKLGVNARGFDEAIIDAKLVSGSLTTAVFEVMYWSDQGAAFVLAAPTEEVTFSGTGPLLQARINARGRTFFLRCKTLTGTSPVLDLDVAGVADGSGQ